MFFLRSDREKKEEEEEKRKTHKVRAAGRTGEPRGIYANGWTTDKRAAPTDGRSVRERTMEA